MIDIGIPRGGPARAGGRPDRRRRAARACRAAAPDSTKFSSGNVVIIGGSRGLTGAPTMSALAAMRSGAGYVTVGAPASSSSTFTVRLLEAMMVGLPEDGDGRLDAPGGRAGAEGDRPRRRRRARARALGRTPRARRRSRARCARGSTCRW